MQLHSNPKMDHYTNDYAHRIYDFGQPCLTFLASCIRITYGNYNTTIINEALTNNFFVTTL